MKRDWPSPINT